MKFRNVAVLFVLAASATVLAFAISLAAYTAYLYTQIGHATGH